MRRTRLVSALTALLVSASGFVVVAGPVWAKNEPACLPNCRSEPRRCQHEGRRPLRRHLRGTNLTGAILSLATLTGTIFTNANLTNADLNSANLAQRDLAGAVLVGTNLKSADLAGAVLEGVDLSGANLSYAMLERADVTRCQDGRHPAIRGEGRRCGDDKRQPVEGEPAGRRLLRAELTAATLTEAKAYQTRFSRATLVAGHHEGCEPAVSPTCRARTSPVRTWPAPACGEPISRTRPLCAPVCRTRTSCVPPSRAPT